MLSGFFNSTVTMLDVEMSIAPFPSCDVSDLMMPNPPKLMSGDISSFYLSYLKFVSECFSSYKFNFQSQIIKVYEKSFIQDHSIKKLRNCNENFGSLLHPNWKLKIRR
jgi:hypothetical protein